MIRPAFFTVVYHKDYDYLLGAIEQHAEMGPHLVLDTSAPNDAKRFTRLPKSVIWIHEPFYGEGWKEFRLRSAVESALHKARLLDADILVYLDSDEFYTKESVEMLFPWAEKAMVEVQYVHWLPDGNPYTFGASEWHPRLWPRQSAVDIAANIAWQHHPAYNGNPEHHPVPWPPSGLQTIRVYGAFRHHVHYGIGPKVQDLETAKTTIDGWPDAKTPVPAPPLPERLRQWRDESLRPSEAFL